MLQPVEEKLLMYMIDAFDELFKAAQAYQKMTTR